MPKQIPHLKEQIMEAAADLFSRLGYDAVSIRSLAAHVGIAVGTLYNYFPDKQTLFTSLMEASWMRTFESLESLLSRTDLNGEEKLPLSLEILYDGIKGRGGFARKALGLAPGEKVPPKPRGLSRFRDDLLFRKLSEVLLPLGGPFAGLDAYRLTQTVVVTIRSFIFATIEDTRREDLAFLTRLIQGFQEVPNRGR